VQGRRKLGREGGIRLDDEDVSLGHGQVTFYEESRELMILLL
jgi:hypothetical protein